MSSRATALPIKKRHNSQIFRILIGAYLFIDRPLNYYYEKTTAHPNGSGVDGFSSYSLSPLTQ